MSLRRALLLLLLLCGCAIDEDEDGWSPRQGDCDDADPSRHPEATETCNRIDDDCDGTTDENDDVEPLAPGIYGLADAHVRIVGDGNSILFGGSLHRLGDTTGDGADDFLTNARCSGEPCLGLHASGFCTEDFGKADALARLPVLTPGYGGHLGDVDGDGLADAVDSGRIYLSPLEGFQADYDFRSGPTTAAQAADLDRDGHPDLVIGDTTNAQVRFHRGPFEDGELGPFVAVNGYALGTSAVALPGREPPTTIISTGGSLHVVEGLPQTDQDGAPRLDVEPLFGKDAAFIGSGLASDGYDRICVGTDGASPPLVVCGTLESLESGSPELVFEDDPKYPGLVGPTIGMTRDLVAVTYPWATVGDNDGAGRVRVQGEAGSWTFEWDRIVPLNEAGFTGPVALLRDPIHGVTWLVASAPWDGEGGVIYIFALDVPPTM